MHMSGDSTLSGISSFGAKETLPGVPDKRHAGISMDVACRNVVVLRLLRTIRSCDALKM